MTETGAMTAGERETLLDGVHAWRDEPALAIRYLGEELGPWYVEHNPRTADSLTVRLRPEHWRTFDFAKLF